MISVIPDSCTFPCMLFNHSVVSDCNHMDCRPPKAPLSVRFPNKITIVGCHFLPQGTFPTQGLNLVSWLAGRFFTAKPPGKPIDGKALNFLTWDIWFPLINKYLLTFTLPCLCYKTSLKSGSSLRLLGAVLSGLLEMLLPRLEVLKIPGE